MARVFPSMYADRTAVLSSHLVLLGAAACGTTGGDTATSGNGANNQNEQFQECAVEPGDEYYGTGVTDLCPDVGEETRLGDIGALDTVEKACDASCRVRTGCLKTTWTYSECLDQCQSWSQGPNACEGCTEAAVDFGSCYGAMTCGEYQAAQTGTGESACDDPCEDWDTLRRHLCLRVEASAWCDESFAGHVQDCSESSDRERECSECLDSCRGLSGCCQGDGCICYSACDGA